MTRLPGRLDEDAIVAAFEVLVIELEAEETKLIGLSEQIAFAQVLHAARKALARVRQLRETH